MISKITPCLWFDHQAEEAANFYVSVFQDAKFTTISYYPEAGREQHGRAPGSVMVVAFELHGQSFVALNGGPHFQFTPAISLQIDCATQEEVDHYWEALGAGGPVEAQQCGWVQDRFGVSWQVIPSILNQMIEDPDRAAAERAFAAMMGMKKLDIAELERAFAG